VFARCLLVSLGPPPPRAYSKCRSYGAWKRDLCRDTKRFITRLKDPLKRTISRVLLDGWSASWCVDLVFDPLTSQIHVHATDQPEETRLRQESCDQLCPYLDSEICGGLHNCFACPGFGDLARVGWVPIPRSFLDMGISKKVSLCVGLENKQPQILNCWFALLCSVCTESNSVHKHSGLSPPFLQLWWTRLWEMATSAR